MTQREVDNLDTFPAFHGGVVSLAWVLEAVAWRDRMKQKYIKQLAERRVKHLDTSVIMELLNIE